MPPWLIALLGAFFVVCVAVVYSKVTAASARESLAPVFAGRTHEAALATCYAALPGIEHSRIQQAYRWVQELVPFPEPPIHASDLLDLDLFVTRRGVDLQMMASSVWLNPSLPESWAPQQSLRTVADLMAEVLRLGYEAYPGRKA